MVLTSKVTEVVFMRVLWELKVLSMCVTFMFHISFEGWKIQNMLGNVFVLSHYCDEISGKSALAHSIRGVDLWATDSIAFRSGSDKVET